MNRRTTLTVAVAALATSLAAGIWYYSCRRDAPAYSLDDDEVESITAEIYGIDLYDLGDVPPTEIPKEFIPTILDALRPIATPRSPSRTRSLWGKLPRIGKMTATKQDRTQVEITWQLCGQNRLAYEYNGVPCYRGGPYEPMDDIVDNHGHRLGYGDESLTLAKMIEGIHHELANGIKSEQLVEAIEYLECSRGKRPPKK